MAESFEVSKGCLLPQDSYDLAGDPLVGVGFLPTIRISHNDRTKEAKWDSKVLVEACSRKVLNVGGNMV